MMPKGAFISSAYNADMESSGYIIPSTSRINEHEVALIELVEHGGTGAAACIYADESGKRRYVTLDD